MRNGLEELNWDTLRKTIRFPRTILTVIKQLGWTYEDLLQEFVLAILKTGKRNPREVYLQVFEVIRSSTSSYIKENGRYVWKYGNKLLQTSSLEEYVELNDGYELQSTNAPDPLENIYENERKDIILSELKTLPHWEVLYNVFFKNLTIEQAGKEIGLCRKRAGIIRREGLERLAKSRRLQELC